MSTRSPLLPLYQINDPTTMQWQTRWKSILDAIITKSNSSSPSPTNLDSLYLRLDGTNHPTANIDWGNHSLEDLSFISFDPGADLNIFSTVSIGTTIGAPFAENSTGSNGYLPMMPNPNANINPIAILTLRLEFTGPSTVTVTGGSYAGGVTAVQTGSSVQVTDNGSINLNSYDVIVATNENATVEGAPGGNFVLVSNRTTNSFYVTSYAYNGTPVSSIGTIFNLFIQAYLN